MKSPKYTNWFIAAASLLVVATVSVSLFLKPKDAVVSYQDFSLLEHEVDSFKKANTESKSINFGLYAGSFIRETLSTSNQLNFFSEERYNGMVPKKALDCNKVACDTLHSTKDDIYKSYLCGHTKKLPFNFFAEPPYMSKQGYSFVYLAYHSGIPTFNNTAWLTSYSQYLSLPELIFSPTLRNELNLDKVSVNSETLSQMQSLNKIIIQGENIFIKEDGQKIVYRKYALNQFEEHIAKNSLFAISSTNSSLCVLKTGSLCITKLVNPEEQKAELVYMILLLVLSLFLITLAVFAFIKLQKNRQQSSLRKLALDNLTHDFRTPVANMLLMSKDFDQIFEQGREDEQIKWLSFSSQVHKLHRATEDTKNYTQLLSSNKMPLEQIDSINSFLTSFADITIDLKPLPIDCSIIANPYWLHVCIENLLKNAQDHGGSQIRLQATASNSEVKIDVIDSGDGLGGLGFDIEDEFVKRPGSNGLGLGLSITKKAVSLMNGHLTYSTNPTKFSIYLKQGELYNEKNLTH